MTQITVPSAPANAVTETDPGKRSTPVDAGFDATLRQARPGPQNHGPGATTHTTEPTPNHTSTDPSDPKKDRPKDTRDNRQPIANPAMAPGAAIPATMPAAAPARQTAAGDGNPVPPSTLSKAGASIVLGKSGRPGGVAATARAQPQSSALNGPAVTSEPATDATGTHLSASQASVSPGSRAADAGSHQGGANSLLTLNAGNSVAPLIHVMPAHGGAAPNGQAPLQLAMQATPGQPQFVHEATQHVAWLVGNRIQQAEIQLNPRALGPIRIDISTHHDRVDVSFAVQNPQTVQALQQTLPQLAELLAQQGLNLGQASVGQQAPGQQHAPHASHPANRWNDADVKIPAQLGPVRSTQRGRVDEFA